MGLLGVPSKQKLVSHYSRRHRRRHCKTGVNILSAYCKPDRSQQYEHGTGQHGAAREAPGVAGVRKTQHVLRGGTPLTGMHKSTQLQEMATRPLFTHMRSAGCARREVRQAERELLHCTGPPSHLPVPLPQTTRSSATPNTSTRHAVSLQQLRAPFQRSTLAHPTRLVSRPLADGLASLEGIVHHAGVGAPAVPAGLVPRAHQLRWRGGGGGAEEELGSRAGRRCVIPCGRTQG